MALAILLLVLASWLGALAIGVAGILVLSANFHCFLLQRYNRIRLFRVLGRPASR